MSQNLIEKITQKFSENSNKELRSGDFVTIVPRYLMTHDNTGAVIKKFNNIGADSIYNPEQIVFTLDHDIQNKSPENLKKYLEIENFAHRFGIQFYPAGTGIGHQIMCEEGFVLPGTLVVASDSHSNIYGGIGALGTPVVRSDALSIWATGKTWWKIPDVVKIELYGIPHSSVSGKDIVLNIAGLFPGEELLNKAIEFCGDGIQHLSIADRLTISNMTTELGALAGVFPVDEVTKEYFRNLIVSKQNHPRLNIDKLEEALSEYTSLLPDSDAFYSAHIKINLSTLSPAVAGPDSPKKFFTLSSLGSEKIKIHKAYLLSCTNGRLEDLEKASLIIQNNKIHPDVKFYVSAASLEIENRAEKMGIFGIFRNAGAVILPPGCGPCIGLGEGLLEENETAISATNRNFRGRMGNASSSAYLASPETVAYSAIKGYICGSDYEYDGKPEYEVYQFATKAKPQSQVEIINSFPSSINSAAIFCNNDNINTDAIYPGKYTYQDNMTPEEMADVVFENYSSSFTKVFTGNQIICAGYNFGCGSSREQAASALKYKDIKAVIAASFSDTYLKNAINNGLICITQQEFISYLRNSLNSNAGVFSLPGNMEIDFTQGTIVYNNRNFLFSPPNSYVQEIISAGGLENKLAGYSSR